MNVTVVRIYVTEGEHMHQKIFKRLHDDHKVKGVTVFRGITGFGNSGRMHSTSLLDLSLDMPVVVEFYDEEDKVRAALDSLRDVLKPGHVLTFNANLI